MGGPVLSPEEEAFALRLSESIDKKQKVEALKAMDAPKEVFEQVNTTVIEPLDKGKAMAGLPMWETSAGCP